MNPDRPPEEGEQQASARPGGGCLVVAASGAGFLGAIPFGIVLDGWLDVKGWQDPGGGRMALASLLAVPFGLGLIWATWKGRALALAVAGVGVVVGAGLVAALNFLVGFVAIPILGLGLLLGLATIGPCWERRETGARALAILGPTPGIAALVAAAVSFANRPAGFDPVARLGAHWPQYAEIAAGVILIVAIVAKILASLPGPPKDVWDDFDRP